MEDPTLPISDKIIVWPHRDDLPVDESLIPPGKDPQVLDIPNGMNLPKVYDATWDPTD